MCVRLQLKSCQSSLIRSLRVYLFDSHAPANQKKKNDVQTSGTSWFFATLYASDENTHTHMKCVAVCCSVLQCVNTRHLMDFHPVCTCINM
mmetsp:Transcript_64114/g.93862  ORF Transcript_64114/g.93862 Transcript_64114/m.93862 type:complete len:91 (+) Transcript_64114:436-708(+)